jgi:hypothetical protein
MISNINTLNPTTYTHYMTGGATYGKLVVPVSPMMVMYSQLKHVSGVASTSATGGVNINKVQILNTLIDRLINMKQKVPEKNDSSRLSENQVDVLIKDYETQIKNTIAASESNPYVLEGGSVPTTGSLFTIAA